MEVVFFKIDLFKGDGLIYVFLKGEMIILFDGVD